jgi:hypothetical protein
MVIGARRDPGVTDIGWLRRNRDKCGMFRCGTGGEQRKHEQGEAGEHRTLSERPGVSIIYRRMELWLAIQHRCTQN